jgi:four helix bundle protein
MSNYNLEERTAQFGEDIIEFAKVVPKDHITVSLVSQLVRAATSVGANYCEADNACSKKDFINKISLCRKESRETKHWLRMIIKATNSFKENIASKLTNEARELNLIFSSIINTCKKKRIICSLRN